MLTTMAIAQPLCFSCANGLAVVLLEVAMTPGGIRQPSRTYTIIADGNVQCARKAAIVTFCDNLRERLKKAQEFGIQRAAIEANRPSVTEVLSQTTGEASVDHDGDNATGEPPEFTGGAEDEPFDGSTVDCT
jgi:hypothetical protein